MHNTSLEYITKSFIASRLVRGQIYNWLTNIAIITVI